MAIRTAREHQPGRDNLSWGKYVQAAGDQAFADTESVSESVCLSRSCGTKSQRSECRNRHPMLQSKSTGQPGHQRGVQSRTAIVRHGESVLAKGRVRPIGGLW